MKLGVVAAALGARLVGDGEAEVVRVTPPDQAVASQDLVLAMGPARLESALNFGASLAVVAEGARVPEGSFIGYLTVKHPRYALAILMELFKSKSYREPGIHPSAVIPPDVELGEGVSIGALAVVESGARIGRGSIIGSQVSVGAHSRLGAGCLIHSGVRIGERVVIGERVIVHYNTSIGSDGFSFVTPNTARFEDGSSEGESNPDRAHLTRINSNGTVIIGDEVEIGANTTIDRATIGATQVGEGTKIDNQVQIAHNVQIGRDCLICGMSGIAGSTVIGDRVVLAGQVGVKDHLHIGSDAMIAAGSGVGSNVPAGAVYIGYPAIPRSRAIERMVYINRLKSLFAKVRELRQQMMLPDRCEDGTS